MFTSFVLFEGEKFHGGGRVWYFNVIWLKSIHTFTFIVTVFTASASIRVSARNASLYIAVMIFCAQPYLKPCFMCPFYILSTCPSKGLCTALLEILHCQSFAYFCSYLTNSVVLNTFGPFSLVTLMRQSAWNWRHFFFFVISHWSQWWKSMVHDLLFGGECKKNKQFYWEMCCPVAKLHSTSACCWFWTQWVN